MPMVVSSGGKGWMVLHAAMVLESDEEVQRPARTSTPFVLLLPYCDDLPGSVHHIIGAAILHDIVPMGLPIWTLVMTQG